MLLECNFVELVQKMWRHYLCPELFEQEGDLPKTLDYSLSVIHNSLLGSISTISICSGFVVDLLHSETASSELSLVKIRWSLIYKSCHRKTIGLLLYKNKLIGHVKIHKCLVFHLLVKKSPCIYL